MSSQKPCGRCGHPLPPTARQIATCEEPGCAEPICPACARLLDRRACRAHTRSWSERVAWMRGRLAAGDVPLLLDRETAAQREMLFLRELERRLRGLAAAELNGEKVAPVLDKIQSGEEPGDVLLWLSRLAQPEGIREALPRNRWLEVPLRRAGLLGRRPASLLRLEVLSDLERQVWPGYETEPRGAALLAARLQAFNKQPRPEVDGWSILALAATSGWNDEARRRVLGQDGGELRLQSGIALALVDLERDELVLPPGSPLGPELIDLLRPSPRLALTARAKTHLLTRLQGGQTLTAEEVAEELGTAPETMRAALAALERDEAFDVREIPKLGLAISLKKRL